MKLSWEKTEQLIQATIEKIKSDGFTPDVLLMIGISGFIPAVFISKALHVKNIQYLVVSSYVGRISEKAKIVKAGPIDIKGKKVLVIDDIVATGQTLDLAEGILKKYEPNEIKFAAPVVSARICKRYPDYYGEAIMRDTNDFITFPWDEYEHS